MPETYSDQSELVAQLDHLGEIAREMRGAGGAPTTIYDDDGAPLTRDYAGELAAVASNINRILGGARMGMWEVGQTIYRIEKDEGRMLLVAGTVTAIRPDGSECVIANNHGYREFAQAGGAPFLVGERIWYRSPEEAFDGARRAYQGLVDDYQRALTELDRLQFDALHPADCDCPGCHHSRAAEADAHDAYVAGIEGSVEDL